MAQAVSVFGDRLTQLALAALVYAMTGSEIEHGTHPDRLRGSAGCAGAAGRCGRRPRLAQDGPHGDRLHPGRDSPHPRAVERTAPAGRLRSRRPSGHRHGLLQPDALRGTARHRAAGRPASCKHARRDHTGRDRPHRLRGRRRADRRARRTSGLRYRLPHLLRLRRSHRADDTACRGHVACPETIRRGTSPVRWQKACGCCSPIA